MGRNIKYYRQSIGLTQKELADIIGTTWEMVSRYETGKSSPYRRIEQLADALHVPIERIINDNTLTESSTPYRFNSIPFINKPFIDLVRAITETKEFYTAPDWIAHFPGKPFAINVELLDLETSHLASKGVVYAIRDKPSSFADIIIYPKGNRVAAVQYGSAGSIHKVLATVLAFEKRFR